MTILRHASGVAGLTVLLSCGSCASPESGSPQKEHTAVQDRSPKEQPIPEATKKQIYSEGFESEHRAMREADAKYPVDYSKPDALQQLKTKGEYERALIEAYNLELMKKHGISKQQYQSIIEEGVAQKWPKPSFHG